MNEPTTILVKTNVKIPQNPCRIYLVDLVLDFEIEREGQRRNKKKGRTPNI